MASDVSRALEEVASELFAIETLAGSLSDAAAGRCAAADDLPTRVALAGLGELASVIFSRLELARWRLVELHAQLVPDRGNVGKSSVVHNEVMH